MIFFDIQASFQIQDNGKSLIMTVIDVDRLLQDITPDEPCGQDLEYDAAFGEMERASLGKPEQQFGETLIPAEEPSWSEVQTLALELLARTKDLRVAVHLTQALVHTHGLPGLGDGLTLLHGLLDRFWDTIHPQLDPDDDNDPTLRINVLSSLCAPDTMLHGLREMPLVESRALGRFSLRDIQVASGQISPAEGETSPDIDTINGAFMDCDAEAHQAVADAARRSIRDLKAIETLLGDRVGADRAPDFAAFSNELNRISKVLDEQLSRRGLGQEESSVGVSGQGSGEAAPGVDPPPPSPSGDLISSREDVVRVIDKICEYYTKREPSSPVPLLLKRAKKLASKSFLEIVRDMAPDGVSQVETIGGVDSEDSNR